MAERILYIEDNQSNRILVRRVLEAEGMIVIEAETASEGIQMATLVIPDLILMDLSMPVVDGLSATRRIREVPHLRDVPIVALTAHVMRGDRDKALAICDGYISKPIDVDSFTSEIRSYIRS
jgi:two-component system cell cycle response regulator DivK